MRLFQNNYNLLKNENLENMLALNNDLWEEMNEFIDYCTSHGVSIFELEVIKKDLISLALEADLEGISLEQKLGITKNEFCDNLLQDCSSRKWSEHLLEFLRETCMYSVILYFIDFLASGFSFQFGFAIENFVFIIVLCVFRRIIYYLYSRKAFRSRFSASALSDTVSISLYVIYYAVKIIFSPEMHFLFTGNGWLILAGFVVILSAVWLGSDCYWNKQSAKYNWQ